MNLIVAVDKNWAIGKDGNQPIYIQDDLKHFKELTLNQAIIVGRNTLSTFPGGRPLKGRRNLILSSTLKSSLAGVEIFSTFDTLLAIAPKNAFVVGGASIYAALLNQCDVAYVTKIDLTFQEADCFFPNLDTHPDWHIAEKGRELEENTIKFRYTIYKRHPKKKEK